MDLLFVPLIVFLVLVAPIWLILHYRSKKQLHQGLSHDERNQLNELLQKAEKMNQRIKTLEAILDSETPDWRERNE